MQKAKSFYRVLWFVGLWCASVLALGLVALIIRSVLN